MLTIDKKEFNSAGIRVGLLSVLALFSGCCGLAYEVLYVRALTAILGDMFYVHAALLSTFLVGIGLGAKLAHRWLRWLWVFQVLTGLYALGLPVILKWISEQSFMSLVTSSPALTILATVGFISPPSLLIGFSIPLFSAYIKAQRSERLAFQGIYKIYNLGAFISILGVELALIRYLGIRLSIAVVGIINLFSGVVLLAMRAAPAHKPLESPRNFPKRIMFALAMASLGSAVFQMFFLKLSYLVFHPHRENFAIGLSVTMLGLFIGTWLVTKIRIRFETLLIAAAALIGLIYVGYIPILWLLEATIPWTKNSELLVIAHKLIFGGLFALGPMIAFGALIPALMSTEKEVAGESGHLLWVSSLANAAGYLVYVTIGHPLVSSGTLLALIACIMLAASLLAVEFRWSRIQWGFAGFSIIMVILLISGWKDRNFYLAQWVKRLEPRDEVKVFKSGAESATLVHTDRVFKSDYERDALIRTKGYKGTWEDVWISYNGHPSITIQRNGVANYAEVVTAITPAISASCLDRALVIGFGTGISAGAASVVFKATDVVEINKAFYEMMPYLSKVNFDIEHNPSATLHVSDGRAFLVGKDRTYDVIISTVSAPTYFSASKIYTVDFYNRVRESLKPDGLFCTWIAASEMSEEGMLTILSALRQNFRYCQLSVMRMSYYLLTCSNQPIQTRRRFSELVPRKHQMVKFLQRALPDLSLDEFFEDIRLSENIFEHFTPQVLQENTDDHPVLEFMAVRAWDRRKMGSDLFTKYQDLLNIDPVRRGELEDPARLARRANVSWRVGSTYYEKAFQPILMRDPNVVLEFLLLAADYKAYGGGTDEAVDLLKTALKINPDSARTHNNLGNVLKKGNKFDEAVRHFRQALQIRPDFAEAHNNLGSALVRQGKLSEAIGHFQRAVQIRPDLIQAHINLGNALASEGKFYEATKSLRQALADNERSDLIKSDIADVHFNLAVVLRRSNEIRQADEEFAKAVEKYREEIADDPQSFQLNARLAGALAQSGNLPEATVYFRRAVELNPTILENQLKLIETLKLQGRVNEAVKTAQKAIRLFSKFEHEDAIAKLQQYTNSIESQRKI